MGRGALMVSSSVVLLVSFAFTLAATASSSSKPIASAPNGSQQQVVSSAQQQKVNKLPEASSKAKVVSVSSQAKDASKKEIAHPTTQLVGSPATNEEAPPANQEAQAPDSAADSPKNQGQWLLPQEQQALIKAQRMQTAIDDHTREMNNKQAKIRRSYSKFISRTVSERNRLLRDIPHFWYEAIRALPGNEAFLQRMAPTSPSDRPGEVDESLVDDHHILSSYLIDVRCLRVAGNSAHSANHLERTVEQRTSAPTTGSDDMDPSAPDMSVPTDLHSGEVVGSALDALHDSLRLELEFKSNPFFSNLKLFKQVPSSMTLLFYDQNDDENDPHALGDHSHSDHLGLGNSVQWISKREPTKDSIFAAFDSQYYRKLNRAEKNFVQVRFGALLTGMCTYLENSPVAFYEQRMMELERERELDEVDRIRQNEL